MKRVDECGPNTPDTKQVKVGFQMFMYTQQFGKLNSRFTLAWISFK